MEIYVKRRMLHKEPVLQWIRFSESWFTGPKEEVLRILPVWHPIIFYNHTSLPLAVDVQRFRMLLDQKNATVSWPRINTVEYLVPTDSFGGGYWTILPEYIEVDECLVRITEHDLDDQRSTSLFIEEQPKNDFCADVFDCTIGWDPQGAYVYVHSDIPTNLTWHVKNAGCWQHYVQEELEGGTHKIRISPPYGDLVYLLIEGLGQYRYVHRVNVVGKAGMNNGRLLWHRNMTYFPYGLRSVSWTSLVVPVFHLSDIERFSNSYGAGQIQWWLPKSSWYQDAIELINVSYPESSICTIGSFGEEADIVVLKPLELELELSSEQVYACSLFENAAVSDFGYRLGWLMTKLREPKFRGMCFVEHAWNTSVVPTRAHDGTARYGFGYSFTPGQDHENLWASAIRNMIYREEREILPCGVCPRKDACKQMLPSSYKSSGVVLPWNGKTVNCPLPLWISA